MSVKSKVSKMLYTYKFRSREEIIHSGTSKVQTIREFKPPPIRHLEFCRKVYFVPNYFCQTAESG